MTTTTKTMELTFTRTIPAAPAEVFSAWMDPKHPGNPWTDAKKLLFDGRVDGFFYFLHVSDEGEQWPHYGRFLTIERNERVEYGWMSPFTRGLESVVTVTFQKKGDDTVVTLKHANLPDDEKGRAHEGGWTHFMGLFAEQFPVSRRR